ncbi:MAG: YrbL family protein [Achromobacter veterisilvae]|jgi:hypothetical protein
MFKVSVRHGVAEPPPSAIGLKVLSEVPSLPGASAPFEILDLRQVTIAAAGSERDVYLHPTDRSLLIKIINRARIDEVGRKRPWHKRFQREDAHRVFIAEIVEYIATTVRQRADQGNTLMARIAGVVLTSQGLGLVVERIVDVRGDLAPTLRQVVAQQGFGPELRVLVHEFFMGLIDAHVIFNDVSASNIVLGFNADGRKGLYLVDGFGSKQLLPLYAWSKVLNGRRLLRKYQEMARKLS